MHDAFSMPCAHHRANPGSTFRAGSGQLGQRRQRTDRQVTQPSSFSNSEMSTAVIR